VDIQSVASLLTRIELFSQLDAETIQEISARVRQRTMPKGQTIYMQGEPAHQFFVLAEGAVKLLVTGSNVDLVHEIDRYKSPPPEVFGEVAVLDGISYTTSAEVVEKATLLVIDASEFRNLVRSAPEGIETVLGPLARLARRPTRQFINVLEHRGATR
jgi:CRP-like cAMP-binding protein